MPQVQSRWRRVAELPLLPLRWLERAQGRARRRLIALYVTLGLLAALALWWATSLRRLPNVGDPFDVAAFLAEPEPDDRAAAALYRLALERYRAGKPLRNDEFEVRSILEAGQVGQWAELHAQIEAHRPSLELWREAASHERVTITQPADLRLFPGQSRDAIDLYTLALMALLEADRLREDGDLAGSWDWYRAALRSSRHIGRRGPSDHRVLGQLIVQLASPGLTRWIDDPGNEPALIRRAIVDVRAASSLTPPNSDAIRGDYLAMMHALDHPEDWLDPDNAELSRSPLTALGPESRLFRATTFWKREPERSKRVFRIIFAHWLAHADDPPARRPVMAADQRRGNHSYPGFPYRTAPGRLDAAHPISAVGLYDWYASTLYGRLLMPPLVYHVPAMDRDRQALAMLPMALAERLYTLEKGRPPAVNGDLVTAGYLDQLPEGYDDPPR